MELKAIIGGVLGSVAEARSISDRVSRQLAVLYEQDELMRAFPVPRMEIDKIDVDLKFALQPNSDVPGRTVYQTAELVRTTAISGRNALMEAVAQGKLSGYITFPRSRNYDKLGAAVQETIEALIQAPSEVAVTAPPDKDVQLQTFDVEACAERIIEMWMKLQLATVRSDKAAERIASLLQPVQSGHESQIALLRTTMMETAASLDAVFAYKDLVELPENVLSSIRLSINVRNYEWTQVGDRDGEPVRKLIRE